MSCIFISEIRASIFFFLLLQRLTRFHLLGLGPLRWHFTPHISAVELQQPSVEVTLTYSVVSFFSPSASTVARHSASSPWVRSSSRFVTAPRGTSSLWWRTPAGERPPPPSRPPFNLFDSLMDLFPFHSPPTPLHINYFALAFLLHLNLWPMIIQSRSPWSLRIFIYKV